MKIYINGKYLLTRLTGVQRVATEIVNSMTSVIRTDDSAVELIVLTPPEWLSKSYFRPILALLWEQVILPIRSRDGMLLSLCNTGPVFFKKNHVIVLHDAAVFDFPQNYSKKYVFVHRLLMKLHAKNAARLFTVSLFSQKQLSKHLDVEKSKISLLGEGVEHIKRLNPNMGILDKLGIVAGGYIVAVGSRQPGKNFSALCEATKIGKFSIPVVIVGGYDKTVFSKTGSDVNGNVIDAGYVDDDELVALIKNAKAYVQPSLYEGFGLPVAEAMCLGVPVLCSCAASLPEVCGDAAIYFDPHSPSDISEKINNFINNESKHAEYRDACEKRSLLYSWDRSAENLLSELKSMR
ncbi:glycosyltransferase family 1 protein [Pectobacterium aroidearum]|uniref:glycosyltransferase family 4 protein n=1 Tax=Pectobacterium aroidearum TaxID=1201031 RepID=UPI0032ED30BE